MLMLSPFPILRDEVLWIHGLHFEGGEEVIIVRESRPLFCLGFDAPIDTVEPFGVAPLCCTLRFGSPV